LRLAATKAGWGKSSPQGEGQGIAAFFSFESYAAAVAEVSANAKGIIVKRIVCAVDCGRPVNPNGIRAQVESAAIYALTATVKDAITVEGGRVVQTNFNDYDMIRMNEAPVVEVHVVNSNEAPTGIGEPTVPVIAPAICNAIQAATGKRLRRLPLRASDLA
jgi:isoquinoline 1-oxidoreductase subunit beta